MNTIISSKGQIIIHDVISIVKNAIIFLAPQFISIVIDGVNDNESLGVYGNIIAMTLSLILKGIDKKYKTSTYETN